VLEAYEFRRFQTGANAFWTPLRFSGQYFDSETDLFENWNRYYSASIGSYFRADPLPHDRRPSLITELATLNSTRLTDEQKMELTLEILLWTQDGRTVLREHFPEEFARLYFRNPYSYAGSNPIIRTDRTGLATTPERKACNTACADAFLACETAAAVICLASRPRFP
jgi:RHS repeat-associated protein